MKIYLASGNLHKKQEMASIFSGHTILVPADDGITFDPEENGKTFLDNSLIKAKALWDLVRQPVLADDSGICVDILDGVPGIYSARYAGKEMHTGRPGGRKISQEERNQLLLEEVAQVIESGEKGCSRSCRYVCAMTLYLGFDRFYAVQETMEGSLVEDISQSRGKGGFGYDPIVIIKSIGKTVAEISPEEKNKISHRGKAGAILNAMLENLPFTAFEK